MFKLPIKPGESSTLWEHDDDGVPERLRVVCHEGPMWTLVPEIYDCEKWEEGPICLDGYREQWTRLVLALNPHARDKMGILRAIVKGNTTIPTKRGALVKFARVTGGGRFWVAWRCEGDNQSSVPMLVIEFSRPLDADELLATTGQMAKAFDKWDEEHGER